MPATSNFRGKKLLQAITSLMDSLESRYRSVFLETIENITNSPDIAEIIRDIRLGNITTIDNATLARIQGVQLNTYDLTVASRQAMASGGKITAKTVGLEGKFNLQNPRAINAARTLSDELVGTLSKTVTKNLTDIITDAVSGTDSLSETVRRIKDEIGLTTQHSAAVKNYRKNLIQTGMDKAKALSQSEKYAKRLLKYRAETIARTEVAIAVNKGQAEFWKQMKDDGSIPPTAMRIWIAEMDSKTCEICSPLNGELAPIDGSWSTGAGFFDIPHAHPRCRCTSGLVFPSKITKDDPTGYEQWVISKGDFVGHPFRGNQWTKVRTPSPIIIDPLNEASVNDAFWESVDKQKAILSEPEKIALERYTSNGYEETNSYLRGTLEERNANMTLMERGLRGGRDFSAEEGKKSVEYLDTVFEKTSVTVSQDVVLYRGMITKTSKASETWAAKLKVGDVIEDSGFVSTSYDRISAKEFASSGVSAGIMFIIRAKSGTKMMAGEQPESELILNRGSKMRVVNDVSFDLGRIGFGELVMVEVELI